MQIAELLDRMALAAAATADGSAVRVRVPPTRSDVLHACDVIEARSPALLPDSAASWPAVVQAVRVACPRRAQSPAALQRQTTTTLFVMHRCAAALRGSPGC